MARRFFYNSAVDRQLSNTQHGVESMVMEHEITGQSDAPGIGRRQWVVVVALAALTAGLLVEVGRSLADDDVLLPPPAGRQEGSIVAVPGQISRDSYGIYLVDLKNETICVYQYQTSPRTLKLLAARMFTYDTQLDEYNSEPSPREIRQMVTAHRRLTDEPAEPPVVNGDGGPTEPHAPGDDDAPAGADDPDALAD